MGLDKRIYWLLLLCALCSPLTAGNKAKVSTVKRTPYGQILTHIHYLKEPKFNFLRNLIIRDFATKNNLPQLQKIKSLTLVPSPVNEIKIIGKGKEGQDIIVRVLGKFIKLRMIDKKHPKVIEKELRVSQPHFIASKLFIGEFKHHLDDIDHACSMLDLSEVLDHTEELKDGINDYYSFLVPDTEGSLFPELNEHPKALGLLFSLKKVQRNAILRLMYLTKINQKC